jgi:hypothetical protein
MPPNVTYWVPGLTGVAQPRARNSWLSWRTEKPASARSTPVSPSNDRMRSASRVPRQGRVLEAGSEASP